MPKIVDASLPTEAVEVSMRGRALGLNPSALAVLLALRDGPHNQADLEHPTGLSKATLSEHLRTLEAVGFIRASVPPEERRGRRRCSWSLDEAALVAWLDDLRAQLIGRGE